MAIIGSPFVFRGEDGNDFEIANDWREMYGNAGNDRLTDTGDSLTVRDLIDGGPGHDYLTFEPDASGEIFGGLGNDNLRGGIKTDTLDGGDGDDEIYGGQGNDTLDGGGGTDYLNGGQHNDLIRGGAGNDRPEHFLVASSDTHASDLLIGRFGGLYGGAGGDTLLGGPGMDYLAGGTSGDTLDGGAGLDMAGYGDATDPVTARLDDPTQNTGDAEFDIYVSIEGLGGSDFADTLIGAAGNDTLDGGPNPSNQGDFLLGGAGNDTYLVDSSLDFVDEGVVFTGLGWGGIDTIVSTAYFFWDLYSIGETLRISEDADDPTGDGTTGVGSVFDNAMIANSMTNVLFGRGGSDTYRAGDGIDYISLSTLGLTDDNAYDGVDGVNTVVVEARASGPVSYDIVYEFESGKDRLDVSDYGFASAAAAFATGVNDGAGGCYFILGDGFDYLYMVGLELRDMSAGDFLVA